MIILKNTHEKYRKQMQQALSSGAVHTDVLTLTKWKDPPDRAVPPQPGALHSLM